MLNKIIQGVGHIYRNVVPKQVRIKIGSFIHFFTPANVMLWDKFHPIFFIHTSDLMMPHSSLSQGNMGGVTAIQSIITANLLDIESYRRGEKQRFFVNQYRYNYDSTEGDVYYNYFYDFIEYLDQVGLNPQISSVQCSINPTLDVFNGAHRLAWFLDRNPNDFIPCRMLYPNKWNRGDCYLLYEENNVPDEARDVIFKRYLNLTSQMRRSLVGVILEKTFLEHENEINRILHEYGFIEKTEKHITSRTIKFKGLRIIRNDIYFLVFLRVEYNILNFERNHFYSERINELNRLLRDLCRKNASYFAGSVTESIRLENILVNHSVYSYADCNQ